MAFYIKPPKGNIPIDKLYRFGEKRLQFLYELCTTSENKLQDLIQRAELLEKTDCLIEGTTKDKVSHFLLKIISTEKREMQEFFIQSETVLFSLRLQFHDLQNIRKILRTASHEILDILSKHKFICESYKKILLSLVSVKEQLEMLAKSTDISQEIRVPFIHALDFVQARLAPVCHGYVIINIDQMKPLLITLFEQSLIENFLQLKSSACKSYIEDDLRVREIQHRLQIQYILFLKDIGVPWEEVVKLFEQEYSHAPQHCEQHSTCMHSWSKDRSRYIYSIRHLYGKEGSCNNYRGHSCQHLQSSNMNASDEGGCPFAHFDKKHLQDLVKEVCDIEDLMALSAERKYHSACTSYLMTQLKQQANQPTKSDGIKDTGSCSSNVSQSQFSPSASCLGNGLTLNKNFPVACSGNEFFASLSNLIFHPSDFYKIHSNPVWQKF